MSIVWGLVGYVVLVGLVILVHEAGHFLIARALGIRVTRFAMGLGPLLWRRQSRHSGEWALGCVPIGGYVRFSPDPRAPQLASPGVDYRKAHPARRLAVVLAGPAANLLLAMLLLVAVEFTRTQKEAPEIYDLVPGTPLARAGASAGDRIIAIDGRAISDLRDVAALTIRHALSERDHIWEVERFGERRLLGVRRAGRNAALADPLGAVGISIRDLNAPVVVAGLNAPVAGFDVAPGERVVAIDDRAIESQRDLLEAMAGRANQALVVTVQGTDGKFREINVVPRARAGTRDGVLGIHVALPVLMRMEATGEDNVSSRLVRGFRGGVDFSIISASGLYRLIRGDVDFTALSGPVHIAQTSGHALRGAVTEAKWVQFATFMAVMSAAIGVINLLPVPIVDGGQVMVIIWEWVNGQPLSARAHWMYQNIGIMFVGLLLIAAAFSDLLRFAP